jgi:hypothetical protein
LASKKKVFEKFGKNIEIRNYKGSKIILIEEDYIKKLKKEYLSDLDVNLFITFKKI